MSITGTLSADGTVQVHCPRPGCSATLRVKPRSGRTWVTCAAAGCGHRFVLEVPGLPTAADAPPTSGTQPAPPPIPPQAKDSFDFQDDAPAPPKPRPPRADDRPVRPRRQSEAAKGAGKSIALVAGGVLAALLVGGGLMFGLVYALRDPDTGSPGPVAQTPTSSTVAPVPDFNAPAVPRDPFPPKADLAAAPQAGATPAPPRAPQAGALDEPDEPETAVAQPKKKGPKKAPEIRKDDSPPAGDAIERVKKSTALIERSDGGSGTGFVIKTGLVMTNFHVISGAPLDGLKVSFVSLDETAPDRLKPTLVYCSPERDIAILRVETDRPPLEMCPGGTKLEGLEVAVVGNPTDGVRGQVTVNKVTTGQLAAPIRRNAEWTYYELNAEARPGNSGGPVVDRHTGKLVGVMQSIAIGKGPERSYCIPFGEATKALDRLPAKDKEAEAAKVAAARHGLDYVKSEMPDMDKMARLGMELRRNILQAKADGPGVRVFVRVPDSEAVLSGDEVMAKLKEEFDGTYQRLDKIVNAVVKASPEVPSDLRSRAKVWLETSGEVRKMAASNHKTETAFQRDATERLNRNQKAAQAFEEEYKKFVAALDAAPKKK